MGSNNSRLKSNVLPRSDGYAWDYDNSESPKENKYHFNGNNIRSADIKKREKNFKEQVVADVNNQKVTKEQLRRLSHEITHTAWYLGRKLDLGEHRVQRLTRNFSTDQETKYQILLCWRRQNGWKATVQQLIIALDEAGFTSAEYSTLVNNHGKGSGVLYDKPVQNIVQSADAYKSSAELYHTDHYDENKLRRLKQNKLNRRSAQFDLMCREESRNTNHNNARNNFSQKRSISTPYISWNVPSIDRRQSNRNQHTKLTPREIVETIENRKKHDAAKHDLTNGNCTDDSGIFTLSPPANDITRDRNTQRTGPRRYQRSRTSVEPQSPVERIKRTGGNLSSMSSLRENEFNSTEELAKIFSNENRRKKTYEMYHNNTKNMVRKYESLVTLPKHSPLAARRSLREPSFTRRKFQNSTLPNNYAVSVIPGYNGKMPSHTSLTSIGSHDVINGKYISVPEEEYEYIYNPKTRYTFFWFGGKGRMPSRFRGLISGLDIFPNGDIVASDGDNKRVQIFDKNGNFKHAFDTNTELKPKGLCLTQETQQKVAVCCGDRVNIYDMGGNIINSFGHGVFRNNCYSICCDHRGNFYVTDIVGHTLSVHDKHGKIRKRFGFKGSGMINFNQPVAVVISDDNHMYISDSQNHCVKVYTLAGRPLFKIGSKGAADGLFWNPLGLCMHSSGNILVADCGNNRISEFTPDGDFLRHVLTEDDGLRMPSLIRTTRRGQLIVCEWEKQHVKVFTLETEV